MSDETIIRCRAKLPDADCYDGSPMTRQMPVEPDEDDPTMAEDGTFDGRSIVCDACYVRLMPFTRSGQALHDELPEAIATYRLNAEFVRGTADPNTLVAEAEAMMVRARPGSPWHVSASACLSMALREVERRAAA
jgi:hypothetical protein